MTRLNLGCGPVIADGWVNLDRDDYPGAFRADVLELGQVGYMADVIVDRTGDFPEGAVAHHVLQMVPWPDLERWLRNARAVLRDGGYLRLSVPDIGLVGPMMDGDAPPPPIDDAHERTLDGKVCLWLSQGGATRSVFTGNYLVELCLRAGFRDAAVMAFGKSNGPDWITDLDDRPDRSAESVYVDARR